MDTLPFDLLLSIASFLAPHDYVNLSHVSWHLHNELHKEEIARICVKVSETIVTLDRPG